MSCQTSIVYGFGFVLPQNGDNIARFLKNHKETLNNGKGYYDELCELSDTSDIIELFDDYETTYGEMGVGAAVADIMSAETLIDFSYHCGEDEPTIMFPECFPWQLNQIERSLTERSLSEIISGYMKELGVEGEPGNVKVEYFG